jgi:hypothetical protein
MVNIKSIHSLDLVFKVGSGRVIQSRRDIGV